MISTRMRQLQMAYLTRGFSVSSSTSRFVVRKQIASSITTATCRRKQLRIFSPLTSSSTFSYSSSRNTRSSDNYHHCSFSTRSRNITEGRLPLLMKPATTTVGSFSSASDSSNTSSKAELLIRDLFLSFSKPKDSFAGDGDKTPFLRVKDLHDLLITIGERPSNETLRKLVKEIDSNNDGLIDMDEFLNGYSRIHTHSITGSSSSSAEYTNDEIDELVQVFRTIDRDGNGVLTLDELEGLLSTAGAKYRLDPKEAKEMFDLIDTNNDGSIQFSEYMAFITNPSYSQKWRRLRSAFRATLIVGGPGSGKGLLCEKLVEHAGLKHYSSGEVLRAEVASGSALGGSISDIMKRGDLVPASKMIALLKKHLRTFPGALLALDGFPRTPENYHDFSAACGPPECAIYIDVPDEVMIDRILMRATKEKRADDNIETAKKRIETFHNFAKPTLDCMHDSGITIHKIDGTGTPENVWNDVLNASSLIKQRV